MQNTAGAFFLPLGACVGLGRPDRSVWTGDRRRVSRERTGTLIRAPLARHTPPGGERGGV